MEIRKSALSSWVGGSVFLEGRRHKEEDSFAMQGDIYATAMTKHRKLFTAKARC